MKTFKITYKLTDGRCISKEIAGWSYLQVKRDFCRKNKIPSKHVLKITM